MSKAKQSIVQIDHEHFKEAMRKAGTALSHIKGGYKKVALRSINRTVMGMRTEVVKAVREVYNAPAKDVRDNIFIFKARKDFLRGAIQARGNMSTPLMRYAGRQKVVARTLRKRKNIKGATVQIHAKGSRTVVKRGFIAKSSSGEEQIFARVKKDSRYPIRLLYGPGQLAVLKDDDITDDLQREAERRFEKAVEHEATVLINKVIS